MKKGMAGRMLYLIVLLILLILIVVLYRYVGKELIMKLFLGGL